MKIKVGDLVRHKTHGEKVFPGLGIVIKVNYSQWDTRERNEYRVVWRHRTENHTSAHLEKVA